MPDLPVPLVINEFMADNGSTLADEAGEFEDWIEIHNTGLVALDAGGMCLTDDLADPCQWRIPNGTVVPGGGFLYSNSPPGLDWTSTGAFLESGSYYALASAGWHTPNTL